MDEDQHILVRYSSDYNIIVGRVSDENVLILVQCSKVGSSTADDLQIIVRSSLDDHLMTGNLQLVWRCPLSTDYLQMLSRCHQSSERASTDYLSIILHCAALITHQSLVAKFPLKYEIDFPAISTVYRMNIPQSFRLDIVNQFPYTFRT